MEIKHTVVVILKEDESGEESQYFMGDWVEDMKPKGLRGEMMVRITSTPDAMKLLLGKKALVRYLPEERTDFHKTIPDWPTNWHLTWITNIKEDRSENVQRLNDRIKILGAKVGALTKDRDELCNFITQTGTRMLPDEAMANFELMQKRIKAMKEDVPKPPATEVKG